MTGPHAGPLPLHTGQPGGRPPLYEPLEWAMVRAPLFPADARLAPLATESDVSLMPRDPLLCLAVQVASPDLAAALDRTASKDRSAPRLIRKLRRYVIRMSTRPTPFGLFAGVGLVRWAPVTDLALIPAASRTLTRADMGWLHDLAEQLDSDPDISQHIRLMANPAVFLWGSRAVLSAGTGAETSVRATAAVRRVLALTRVPTTRADLEAAVRDVPGATPDKAGRLVNDLRAQGFLISEFDPALTGGEPMTRLRTCLEATPSPRAHAMARGMARLTQDFNEWDQLPLHQRTERLPTLLKRMSDLHPGSASTPRHLQIDTALTLRATALHDSVAAEAASAAELLLRLSAFPTGMPHMEAYRRAFETRYGSHRRVPLLELIDPSMGLGAPFAYGAHGEGTTSHHQRDQLLLDLALEANRERRTVVELSDETIAQLSTSDPAAENAPRSLDLSFLLAATSPAAIDRGDFQLVVGPNLGAPAAGRNLGRFAGLLGAPARNALMELAHAEQGHEQDALIAEVVYAPNPPRSANVALRPAIRAQEVLINAWPGVPAQDLIPVNELVVGLRSGRFVITWPAGGVDVVGVQGHMLNAARAPAPARFLLEAAHDGRRQFTPFSWGPAAGLGFLPRVYRGRTVLALAQWRLDLAGDLRPSSHDRFPLALSTWRRSWDVPRHVYLAVSDNRLLLDLDDAEHIELLREELKTVPAGQSALLQEALPGPEHAWLPGADGGHMCEIVIPLIRRKGERGGGNSPAAVHVVESKARLRPPGSDWLYLKLYCPTRNEDDLIGGPLRSFAEYATQSGLSDGWFFLRYADPERHIRLRFHGDSSTLIGPLMEHACAWATRLRADGFCTRFSFDTYEREVERYGGEEGTAAAEALFMADSPSVADMLRASTLNRLAPIDLLELAVISIDDLLACLGVSPEERAAFSYGRPLPPRLGGSEYRKHQRALRQALGGALTLEGEVNCLLTKRRLALAPAVNLIDSLRRDGVLWRSGDQLCRTYVHLHLNRLLGTDTSTESLALELLRRTRAGLARAPLATTSAVWPAS
ncbi:lantibiotic dehydratase [Kitasatospora sp. NPDC101157]|uniref:lantibiotic dehydratase n=1 Tax=Kitasatospora sp. NPDC101157 TaxID=3364098 RepID=UPI00381AAA5F